MRGVRETLAGRVAISLATQESRRLPSRAGFSEIVKRFRHRGKEVDVRFWRTRDGREIDFLVEHRGRVHPIEVKLGFPSTQTLPRLSAIAASNWERGQVVTLAVSATQALTEKWRAVPPWAIELG